MPGESHPFVRFVDIPGRGAAARRAGDHSRATFAA